ncbi:MAG: F0F1 ATP synthase subunit A [Flavobacteriales bacterium]|nr:F0F1 ATP synthase subunit A [Flavobacteriales bacterium]
MLKHRLHKAFKPFFLLLSIVFLTSGGLLATEESAENHTTEPTEELATEDAQATHGDDSHQEKEAFNAGEMIMHHVMDSYDIHLMDIGGHAVSIPLPIILYSTEDGLSVFLSSSFHHGHAAKNRYILDHGHIYRLGENNPYANETEHLNATEALGLGYSEQSWGGFFAGDAGSFIDISITKTVAGILITVLLMFLIFGSVAKAYKRGANEAPKGFQALMETLILFIRDEIAKPSIGHKHERFMPFLLTIFFFIWFANILGLIPFIGGFNVTGNIAVTLVLALFTFVVTTINGNKTYWGHIFATPGVPGWLLPLMIPIELLGVFTKPLVLCLRLFANITAGHIIILSFMSLIFIFADIYGAGAGYGASIVSLLFGIFMNTMELLVAFLQAYVFTLLSALYFGSAVEEHH